MDKTLLEGIMEQIESKIRENDRPSRSIVEEIVTIAVLQATPVIVRAAEDLLARDIILNLEATAKMSDLVFDKNPVTESEIKQFNESPTEVTKGLKRSTLAAAALVVKDTLNGMNFSEVEKAAHHLSKTDWEDIRKNGTQSDEDFDIKLTSNVVGKA